MIDKILSWIGSQFNSKSKRVEPEGRAMAQATPVEENLDRVPNGWVWCKDDDDEACVPVFTDRHGRDYVEASNRTRIFVSQNGELIYDKT